MDPARVEPVMVLTAMVDPVTVEAIILLHCSVEPMSTVPVKELPPRLDAFTVLAPRYDHVAELMPTGPTVKDDAVKVETDRYPVTRELIDMVLISKDDPVSCCTCREEARREENCRLDPRSVEA